MSKVISSTQQRQKIISFFQLESLLNKVFKINNLTNLQQQKFIKELRRFYLFSEHVEFSFEGNSFGQHCLIDTEIFKKTKIVAEAIKRKNNKIFYTEYIKKKDSFFKNNYFDERFTPYFIGLGKNNNIKKLYYFKKDGLSLNDSILFLNKFGLPTEDFKKNFKFLFNLDFKEKLIISAKVNSNGTFSKRIKFYFNVINLNRKKIDNILYVLKQKKLIDDNFLKNKCLLEKILKKNVKMEYITFKISKVKKLSIGFYEIIYLYKNQKYNL